VTGTGEEQPETFEATESDDRAKASNPNESGSSPAALAHRFQAWRESARARPVVNRAYRIGVGVVGGAIVIGGLALVPLPGPGWVIVFLGLAVLATEFVWADRLETFARNQVKAWTAWLGGQALWVRIAIGLSTLVVVLGALYGVFAIAGVPGWLPESWVAGVPGW
jgi:uncharacterized protein (TIGR02611 family)